MYKLVATTAHDRATHLTPPSRVQVCVCVYTCTGRHNPRQADQHELQLRDLALELAEGGLLLGGPAAGRLRLVPGLRRQQRQLRGVLLRVLADLALHVRQRGPARLHTVVHAHLRKPGHDGEGAGEGGGGRSKCIHYVNCCERARGSAALHELAHSVDWGGVGGARGSSEHSDEGTAVQLPTACVPPKVKIHRHTVHH